MLEARVVRDRVVVLEELHTLKNHVMSEHIAQGHTSKQPHVICTQTEITLNVRSVNSF